ncbi:hypothetical protein [Streptomyces sp. G45]|uniref:hypothetical protein n=1 Tax=Streptomyces sp. G45 TaxID=3406627 RepID=UPI003C17C266
MTPLIRLSETLALHSVEDALSAADLDQLRKVVDTEPAPPEFSPEMGVYAPAPALAEEILHAAVERALPTIRRLFPSARQDSAWKYVELREGQRVATHVDGIPDPGTAPRRVARLAVTLQRADAGGEFYVETTSSPALWTGDTAGEAEGFAPGTPLTRVLPHIHEHSREANWLTAAQRTRWTTDAAPGVLLVYGAQVLHGVTPVRSGRLRKFVADLTDTPA